MTNFVWTMFAVNVVSALLNLLALVLNVPGKPIGAGARGLSLLASLVVAAWALVLLVKD